MVVTRLIFVVLGYRVVEALGNRGLGEAKLAGQRRGGTPQVVWPERLQAEQFAQPGRLGIFRVLFVLGAAQGGCQGSAVDRLAGIDRAFKDELLIVARHRLADNLDRPTG
ncbi:hypothetical protein AC628_30855 [Bradyrhizobium sp. NAS96.2]|nr:hypothetical protein AC628_30855 [Bradyrhizobium sp. NAS96.2]